MRFFAHPRGLPGAALIMALAWAARCPSGCSRNPGASDLLVLAAASLDDVFEEIEMAFEAAHPDIDIILSLAGSQILAAQLLEGAPADVFASADDRQMTRVAHLVHEPNPFATNELVIIASPDSTVTSPESLGRPGLRIVLAGPDVPAGRYARRCLQKLGLGGAVQANTVSLEDNVRGVLGKVIMGEADAGLVYATDARAAPEGSLRVIPIPPDANVRAVYPIAVVRRSEHAAAAEAFIGFLRGERGGELLALYGFGAP